MSGPTGRRPDGPRLRSSVIPAPTAAPISAAVNRSYCCSRSSSCSVSGSDARPRLLPVVGSALVEVPIVPVLLVKCLNSRLHSTNRGGGCNERRFCFLLHDIKQRVHLVDPALHRLHRLLQTLIYGGNCLTDLLHVDANRGRDVIDIFGNRAGVTHQRIDFAINFFEHVTDFLLTLSEVPRRRYYPHRHPHDRGRPQTTARARS